MTKESNTTGSIPGFRRIIHLDMDAFYASVEMLDNPELKGKPVIVGGGMERGVVSAASYEARKFGVHSAQPIAVAKRLCPQGVFLPGRHARYREISSHIFSIFQRYTPLVEPLSLDEAFLDVTCSAGLFGEAAEIAEEIRALVKKEIQLTVSAGVASSKLIAKIASDCNKPDGITIVPEGREREFLAPLPIKRLWGVGKTTRKTLAMLSVKTIGDLRKLPIEVLESKLGKHGRHLYYASRGMDTRDVEPHREVKSVGNEETYDTDLVDMEIIHRELLALCSKVAKRLRSHEITGKTVTLKVKYNDFKRVTRSFTLNLPTDDGQQLYQQGKLLLGKTLAGKKPVRLIGVTVSQLHFPEETRQFSLFPIKKSGAKRHQINRAVDAINDKFGATAILPGKLLQK